MYLIGHEQQVSGGIAAAWGSPPMISSVGTAIQGALAELWTKGSFFITLVAYMTLLVDAVISVIQQLYAMGSALSYVFSALITLAIITKVIGWIGGLAIAVTGLIAPILQASAAIAALIVAGLGLSAVTARPIAIGIAIVTLVGVVLGGVAAFKAFGKRQREPIESKSSGNYCHRNC